MNFSWEERQINGFTPCWLRLPARPKGNVPRSPHGPGGMVVLPTAALQHGSSSDDPGTRPLQLLQWEDPALPLQAAAEAWPHSLLGRDLSSRNAWSSASFQHLSSGPDPEKSFDCNCRNSSLPGNCHVTQKSQFCVACGITIPFGSLCWWNETHQLRATALSLHKTTLARKHRKYSSLLPSPPFFFPLLPSPFQKQCLRVHQNIAES